MECSQEIEKIKQKYDLLIKEHDSTHLQQKKTLDDFYEKVLHNQSLAEDFRAKFISPSAAQGMERTHSYLVPSKLIFGMISIWYETPINFHFIKFLLSVRFTPEGAVDLFCF